MRGNRRFGKLMNLESLETRALLSASLQVHGGDLFVYGDNSPNSVVVADGGGGQIWVRTENQPKWQSFSSVSRVFIRTGGGDDSVLYRLSNDMKSSRAVDVSTGGGNDVVKFTTDRSGLDFSSPMSFRVRTGTGNDSCATDLRDISLGKGQQASSKHFLKVELALDGGDDDCDGKVTLSSSSTGGISLALDGGTGNDSVACRVSPPSSSPNAAVDYFLKLQLRGGSGIDDMDLDVVCPDASSVSSSSVRVDGGAGDDAVSSSVSVIHSSRAPASPSSSFIKFDMVCGEGNDRVDSSLSVDPACVGGVSQSFSGGSGSDEIFIKMPSSLSSSAAVDYFIKFSCVGDEGNDDIDAEMTLCPSSVSSHSVSLNGGSGSDSVACRVTGSSVAPPTDGTPDLVARGTFMKMHLLGSSGQDSLSASMVVEPGSLGTQECVVDGGSGDDVLEFSREDLAVDLSGGGAGGTTRAFDAFLKLDCVGGQGNDRCDVDLSLASSSSQGTHDVCVDGGIGDDASTIDIQSFSWGATNSGSHLRVVQLGGSGQDSLSSSITIAPGSLSVLDQDCDGGADDDDLSVHVVGDVSSSSLWVFGGGGSDVARVSSNVSVFDCDDVRVDSFSAV